MGSFFLTCFAVSGLPWTINSFILTYYLFNLPPNGQPFILMADRQPTGRYPEIWNVITADLPKLAQLKPGEQLMFQKKTIHYAQQQLKLQQQTWQLVQARIRLKQLKIPIKA